MSKISLTPNASGTGTLSIASPSTNSDYTLTLPAETGTVLTSGGAIDVNASAPADSLAITSSGAIGVGTTTALVTAAGRGNVTINGSSSAILAFGVGGVSQGYIFNNGTDLTTLNDNTGAIIWENNGAERMRIDSSGNLLVGTTTAIAQLGVLFNGNTQNGCVLRDSNNASSTGYMYFQQSTNTLGSITRVGATSAVAYNTTSDYRLKENIAPMVGALEKVAQLKPCTYTWKADGSAGQGFIAHELQAVVPDCVTGEKDAVETYTDEEGNEQTRPVYQGVDTSFLVATLAAAIQELKSELDAAKERIAALEAA